MYHKLHSIKWCVKMIQKQNDEWNAIYNRKTNKIWITLKRKKNVSDWFLTIPLKTKKNKMSQKNILEWQETFILIENAFL